MTNAAAEWMRAKGELNRQRVREWFAAHVGGTRRECAEALGLNECVVGRHIKAIRQEWQR